MRDSRETRHARAFVAGFPIKHSRSPLIHNYWLSKLEIDGAYEKVEVDPKDLATFLNEMRKEGSAFVGGNFTIPHKEVLCRLADVRDETAEVIGAANTLWVEDGKLHVSNTDAYGFAANLDAAHQGWDQHNIAVVYGAGGASRAIIHALKERAFGEIHVLNRTVERARELADHFGAAVHSHPLGALDEVLKGAGLFVNTTSLSMNDADVPDIDFGEMKSGSLVTDIVYVPLKTRFLNQAEEQGIANVDGLGMLLHQAAPGFEKWFGVMPEVDDQLRALIVGDLEKH